MARQLGTRVTRLGNFSALGRLLTLCGSLKIIELAQIFGLLFPQQNLRINFDKIGLASFLASFSQSHPAQRFVLTFPPKVLNYILPYLPSNSFQHPRLNTKFDQRAKSAKYWTFFNFYILILIWNWDQLNSTDEVS